MAETPQQLPRTLWLSFSLLLGLLAVMYLLSLEEMSRARKSALPVFGQIADFTLTNQDGNVTTLADLTNHVWIADIIFTRCAASCPIMTGQMKSLQDALPPASEAKLVTLTTDPDYDLPAILKKYGEHYGADFNRWTFLTGTKKELAGLATDSLKLGSTPVPPQDQKSAVDLFVHSTIFVLVDKQARLRGIFQTEGEDVDWTKIKPQILAALKQLENGG
jgi:protein SCO1